MTATAAPSRDSRQSHRLPWRRTAHVTWLLHRGALTGFFIMFAALTAAIVIAQLNTRVSYASYVSHGCIARPIDHVPCGDLDNALQTMNDVFAGLLIGVSAFPALVGVFLGAPLISRELESGTFRFTWTQGGGRTRFLSATLVLLAAFVTILGCVLGLLLGGWYAHPFEVTGAYNQWQAGLFDTTGWLLAVWTLFALALGSFLGTVLRRTVAAMAATAVAVGGLLLAAFEVLPSLLNIGPLTMRLSASGLNYGSLDGGQLRPGTGITGGWIVRGFFTGPNGHILSASAANRVLYQALAPAGGSATTARWLSLHHYAYWVAYQPAARYWIFQGIEGAGVCALAVLFGFATIRYVRRA